MTALSVNVNKIAVLRNSRGGAEPSVLKAAQTAIAAGEIEQSPIRVDFDLASECSFE